MEKIPVDTFEKKFLVMLLLWVMKRFNPKSPLIAEIVINISNMAVVDENIVVNAEEPKGLNLSCDALNTLRFDKHYHKSSNNRVNGNESVEEKVALENPM